MGKKRDTLEAILRTLNRIEEHLGTIADNTTPAEMSDEFKERFGFEEQSDPQFLTEEESAELSEAEESLYGDK